MSQLRIARGWNWADCARAATLHWKQVAEIETGDRDPAFSTLVKLARAFDLHAFDELLGPLPLAEALDVS